MFNNNDAIDINFEEDVEQDFTIDKLSSIHDDSENVNSQTNNKNILFESFDSKNENTDISNDHYFQPMMESNFFRKTLVKQNDININLSKLKILTKKRKLESQNSTEEQQNQNKKRYCELKNDLQFFQFYDRKMLKIKELEMMFKCKFIDEENVSILHKLIYDSTKHELFEKYIVDLYDEINIFTNEGESLLIAACKHQLPNIVEILLQYIGIDIFHRDNLGYNSFDYCCINKNVQLVEIFISHYNNNIDFIMDYKLQTKEFINKHIENHKSKDLMQAFDSFEYKKEKQFLKEKMIKNYFEKTCKLLSVYNQDNDSSNKILEYLYENRHSDTHLIKDVLEIDVFLHICYLSKNFSNFTYILTNHYSNDKIIIILENVFSQKYEKFYFVNHKCDKFYFHIIDTIIKFKRFNLKENIVYRFNIYKILLENNKFKLFEYFLDHFDDHKKFTKTFKVKQVLRGKNNQLLLSYNGIGPTIEDPQVESETFDQVIEDRHVGRETFDQRSISWGFSPSKNVFRHNESNLNFDNRVTTQSNSLHNQREPFDETNKDPYTNAHTNSSEPLHTSKNIKKIETITIEIYDLKCDLMLYLLKKFQINIFKNNAFDRLINMFKHSDNDCILFMNYFYCFKSIEQGKYSKHNPSISHISVNNKDTIISNSILKCIDNIDAKIHNFNMAKQQILSIANICKHFRYLLNNNNYIEMYFDSIEKYSSNMDIDNRNNQNSQNNIWLPIEINIYIMQQMQLCDEKNSLSFHQFCKLENFIYERQYIDFHVLIEKILGKYYVPLSLELENNPKYKIII